MTLDHDQRAAAQSDPLRPLLVLAGPGSGKTASLVARIAHLLACQHTMSSSHGLILALTFTRNAARELDDRLRASLGDDVRGRVAVRTFHSFGWWLLRTGWATDYLGWGRIRVASASQALQAAAHALAGAGLDLTPRDALGVIGDIKLAREAAARPSPRLHAVRVAYDAWLHERRLIDVSDMLALPVAILRRQPAARVDLQHRVTHIVSDEAQDWTPYQAALLAYAGGPQGAITVVGDPKQCIFGGSSPRYLLELPLVYREAHVVGLRRTYRLHAATLAVANAIAAHIEGQSVTSVPARIEGPQPVLHVARADDAEGAWIAGELRRLREMDALRRWSDATVLVRTHEQKRRIARMLTVAGIPCRMDTATLAQAAAVATIVAWLALLRDGEDSDALLRVLDTLLYSPHHGMAGRLCEALVASGPWTMERLRRECPPDLSEGQKRALAHVVRLYDGLTTLAAGSEPTLVFDAVVERTGMQAGLGQAAAHEIAALRTLAAQEGDVGALQHALAEEAAGDGHDAARVSTVHGFKGQEAEVVFLAGLDDGIFPHRLCLHDGHAGLQRELRAFYVALTRSRNRLYLSASCAPLSPHEEGRPSRFLHLIPSDLLQSA